MELGGFLSLIGFNTLTVSMLLKYFLKIGHNIQLKVNGKEKQLAIYVLPRQLMPKMKSSLNIYNSIVTNAGLITYNSE